MAHLFRVVLLVLSMLGGCSANQFQHSEWTSGWVDVSSDAITPWNSTALPRDRVLTLDPKVEAAVVEWMIEKELNVVLASGSGVQMAALQLSNFIPVEAGESIYLVRTASDAGSGKFLGYINESGLLIMYGVMGGCGEQRPRVVAVSLSKRPSNVFGRCSAAL